MGKMHRSQFLAIPMLVLLREAARRQRREEALPDLKDSNRLPDPSTLRRRSSGLDLSQLALAFARQAIARVAHWSRAVIKPSPGWAVVLACSRRSRCILDWHLTSSIRTTCQRWQGGRLWRRGISPTLHSMPPMPCTCRRYYWNPEQTLGETGRASKRCYLGCTMMFEGLEIA
jgi:hypothetical protein